MTVYNVHDFAPSASYESRKRLGQYFSGVPLAKLLAALADSGSADTIVDPMVGSGDMLVGCLAHGRPRLACGIEIDPAAHAKAMLRFEVLGLPTEGLVCGNAFSPDSLESLPTRAWDLVITNPPYVRYQTGGRQDVLDAEIPSAEEVRAGLVEVLRQSDALDATDKESFRELALGYSGLADLAVPSWLLAASLVRIGGRLAMVVPAAWLSRNYAHPVRYLLHRWFDLHCVVEDADARWFPDALVRTTLVVATRVERRASAFSADPADGYVHVSLAGAAADGLSLVGSAFPAAADSEAAFAEAVNSWDQGEMPAALRAGGTTFEWISAQDSSRDLRRQLGNQRWLHRIERQASSRVQEDHELPSALRQMVGAASPDLVSLGALGWSTGQGLRTGANKFFYVRINADEDGGQQPVTSSLVRQRLRLPHDAMAPAVQRQADLPSALTVRTSQLLGRVLLLERFVLPEDLVEAGDPSLQVMSGDLAEYVRAAAQVNVGSPDRPRFVPELSAVATNVRRRNGLPARFWYQMPPLADRHRPHLLLPRINHGLIKAWINECRASVVDANFSSVWGGPNALGTPHGLLAMLNTNWTALILELVAAVLGGGGLKAEAAHLRRVPFPRLDAPAWSELDQIGRHLAEEDHGDVSYLRLRADSVLLRAVGHRDPDAAAVELATMAAARLAARSTR